MNIVYGVSGEGLGHVFEAIEIASRLKREGHNVRVLTYGTGRTIPWPPSTRRGSRASTLLQLGGMSLFDTVFKNLRIFPFYVRNWRRLRRELLEFRPDVFITAYEPSAWSHRTFSAGRS